MLILACLMLGSCTKDFLCYCTWTNADPPINGEKNLDLLKTNTSTAQELCDAEENQIANYGYDTSGCTLTEVE